MDQRAQLYKYRGNRCAACGLGIEEMLLRHGTFNRLFHFHHVDPTTKANDYKRLMARQLSRRQLEEVDKCVLLCVHCHNLIHAQEIRATLTLSAQVDTRVVSQVVQGWVKADLREKRLTFVSNEPYLLHPCSVSVGTQEPRLLLLQEILGESNLISWLRNIEDHKHVEIYSYHHRKTAMKISHIAGRQASITQLIGFPSTQIEFFATNVPGEEIHFRNGVVVMKSGAVHPTGEVSYSINLL
jgi:hypothetical protein